MVGFLIVMGSGFRGIALGGWGCADGADAAEHEVLLVDVDVECAGRGGGDLEDAAGFRGNLVDQVGEVGAAEQEVDVVLVGGKGWVFDADFEGETDLSKLGVDAVELVVDFD